MDRFRQLLSACEHGEVHVILSQLDQGFVQVDDVDDDEITALQMAAANGQEQVVRLLLMRGAALDKPNMAGWTPLMQACRHGHTNVVALLLQNKADFNALNRLGASALTIAARGGHLQVVRMLLDAGAEYNRHGKDCEITPLMSAAQNGHDSVLRLLLDRGYEVNYQTPSNGLTVLMAAAQNGHMTTAQVLIERGCDPNLTDINDRTALEMAKMRGKREVHGYLDRKTKNKPKVSPEEVKPDIITASKQGDLERISQILKEDKIQVDACSPQDGATPLMFAAMMGRLDIVRQLVENGCDPNKQDTISGWTALMQATYHGQKSVAMFLINEAKTEVTVQAKNGCTAFDMASLLDDVDTELLRLLAEKTMKITNQRQGKKWVKQNGTVQDFSEEHSQNGLRAWWSRMSNRFRNLKLGRTYSTSHYFATGPFQPDTDVAMGDQHVSPASALPTQQMVDFNSYEMILQETKRSATMCTQDMSTPHSNSCDTLKPVIPPFLPQPTFGLDSTDHTSRKLCTGRRTAPVSPVLMNSTTRSSRSVACPSKLLHNRSTGNLNMHHQVNPSTPMMAPASRYFPSSPSLGITGSTTATIIPGYKKHLPYQFTNNPSASSAPGPTSAAVYSRVAMSNRAAAGGEFSSLGLCAEQGPVGNPASASSAVAVPSSDYPPTDVNLTWTKCGPNPATYSPAHRLYSGKLSMGLSAFRNASNTTSPDSSTSGSSSMTPQRSSHGHSTSTLTPSASPTPGKTEEEIYCEDKKHIGSEDELSGILKKLSLERYHPIFEEQEVDMEAFLTLTDRDLKELGISHNESRRQILAAITELETGKGRERQQFRETLTLFQKAQSLTEDLN
ncbi:ankyrin repeat and SAM domain-containing protein 6 [Octopus bimaculoides]|uniref:SAM domain-containing protein n=1 Tax=Octopus bimaculoides TaxID=37653 RepID=A0A0L8GEU6_OCTBM|nr:ankyrin repeat and SAM domain-containing protein 6 [Octopus bimaculoides]|eukprot:XP_014781976.1 PREDICTED: ankyrin repeat and SAM domain-containing protein 6-like [Octopus bimaculoides]